MAVGQGPGAIAPGGGHPIVGTGPGAGPAGGPMGGYQGLAGILSWLTNGGISAQAYANMGAGAAGNSVGGQHYGVPGSHGALRGLSAAGVEWLQKNLMQANAPKMQSLFAPDTTAADGTVTHGAALTGHDLLMAKLQNSLAGLAPTTYGLGGLGDSTMTASDLASAIAGMPVGGPDLFGKGYDANGWVQVHDGHGRYDQFHNTHPGNQETFAQWQKRQGKKK